jgi:hypothetical protein
MLGATVLLSWPAIGRLPPLGAFGLEWILPLSLVLLVGLALAGPIHDLATRRRIHPAYLWGVAAAILLGPLYTLLAGTSVVQAIVGGFLPA